METASKRAVVRKMLDLNAEPVQQFYKYYPGGSLTDVLSLLLEKYMRLHEHTPEEYAEIAANELKDER
jgi:hypothetical protein